MHPQRFDALARRTISVLACRRSLLALAGAAVASSALPPSAVVAGCKKIGQKCDRNNDCCNGSRCKGDRKDKKGKCRCKSGFSTCTKQCCSASDECLGGICVTPPGGCPPGADSCAGDDDFKCGGSFNCECSQSTEGQTLCGDITTEGAACGQCETSADCASFGPGAFCVVTGSVNCCGPSSQNVCRLPCET